MFVCIYSQVYRLHLNATVNLLSVSFQTNIHSWFKLILLDVRRKWQSFHTLLSHFDSFTVKKKIYLEKHICAKLLSQRTIRSSFLNVLHLENEKSDKCGVHLCSYPWSNTFEIDFLFLFLFFLSTSLSKIAEAQSDWDGEDLGIEHFKSSHRTGFLCHVLFAVSNKGCEFFCNVHWSNVALLSVCSNWIVRL